MQIEIAGQKGALWWEYNRAMAWQDVEEYTYELGGDGEDFVTRVMPDVAHHYDESGYTSTAVKFHVYDEALMDTREFNVGYALCSPQDRFSKDRGRKISLARLLKSMNLPKEERTKVWEQYHARKVDVIKSTWDELWRKFDVRCEDEDSLPGDWEAQKRIIEELVEEELSNA